MKELTKLAKVLKPGEVRLIRHFLRLSSNAEERKRAELFEILLTHPQYTDIQVAKKLYGVPPNSAYSHLKGRLKKDMLNALFLHDSSRKFASPYFRAVFDCRKMLNQAFLLNSRGAFDEGVKLLQQASDIAAKHELLAEQILAQQAIRTLYHRLKSEQELEKYNSTIRDNMLLLEELIKVEEFSHVISVPGLFRTNKKVNNPEYKKEMIGELKKSFEKTGLAKAGLWYYLSAIEYYKIADSPKALSLSLQLLKLLKDSPAIYSNNNWGGINMTVGEILVLCTEYERAVGYLRVALKFFPKGLLNELSATELLFFATFRGENYEEAKAVLAAAFKHPRLKANKFYHAKWLYLRANLEFMQERYDDAMKTLNQDTELTKDKSGWLLGYRLLEIMIMIEKEDYEWVDFKIDNFRKLLERQKGENIQRIKLILSILNALHKNNYDFEETSIEESRNFKALVKAQDDLYWNPMGFEVVRFDEWFENRVKASVVKS